MILQTTSKVRLASLLLVFLVVLASSCTKREPVDLTLPPDINGQVVGNVYQNNLLGIRFSIPQKMVVDSAEENEAAFKESFDRLQTDRSEKDRGRAQVHRKRERIVFSMSPPDDDPIFATFNLTVMKQPGNDDLRGMVERAKEFMVGMKGVQLVSPVTDARLGQLDAYSFIVSTDFEGMKVRSKNYGLLRNGYAMTFSISYTDEAGLAEMETVLNGIEAF